MATLKGQTIAASFQDLVKRADTYAQTGTNIELMDDSGDVQATGLYLESGATTDNVGIGGVPTVAKLEIHGGAYNTSLLIKGSGSNSGIKLVDSGNTTDGYVYAAAETVGFLDAGGSWMVACQNDVDIQFSITDAIKMKLDANSRISLSNNDDGTGNTIFGHTAGDSNGAGDYNVFIGHTAGGTGTQTDACDENVGIGHTTFEDLTTGQQNVSVGGTSSTQLTTGNYNTSVGKSATANLTAGQNNIAIGRATFSASAHDESDNVAIGASAMSGIKQDGTAASVGRYVKENIAIGSSALLGGTLASSDDVIGNIAIGHQAMDATDTNAQTGTIAIGASALTALTSGAGNTAVGYQAGDELDDGANNTLVGYGAMHNADSGESDNTCVGYLAGDGIDGGSNNTIIGSSSDPSAVGASNQTVVGYATTGVADNSVTLGNASVTDVYMASDSGAYVHSQNVTDHVSNTMPAPYYRFDGVDDVITVANNADFKPTQAISIVASIYPTDFGTGVEVVHNMTWATDGWTFRITSAGAFALVYIDPGVGVWQTAGSGHNVSLNKHSQIAITFDSATGTGVGYLNGKAAASTSTSTVFPDGSSAALKIGDDLNYDNFKGQISDVKIYNKVLTATEVKELYSGASVPFKYKGANQTELITEANDRTFGGAVVNWNNWGSGTINDNAGAADLVADAAAAVSGSYLACNLNESGLMTAGKRYRIVMDVDALSSGNLQLVDGSGNIIGTIATGTGSGKSLEFTSVWTELGISFSVSSATATIDDVSLTQIGAVAEYDGSGVGASRWDDKSGNELHGTVTGATVENAPADADSGLTYEEGTWDAVVTDGTRPMAMNGSYDTGFYTKVGNLVTVSGMFITTSLDGGSGNATGSIKITGLPFTVKSDGMAYSAGAARCEGLAITAGESVTFYGGIGTTDLILNVWDATTGISDMQASEWTLDGAIILGFTYRAA